jgi:hypothetical protein
LEREWRVKAAESVYQPFQFDSGMHGDSIARFDGNGVTEFVQLQKMIPGLHELRPRMTIALNADALVVGCGALDDGLHSSRILRMAVKLRFELDRFSPVLERLAGFALLEITHLGFSD